MILSFRSLELVWCDCVLEFVAVLLDFGWFSGLALWVVCFGFMVSMFLDFGELWVVWFGCFWVV